jgi:hypothetical protein
MTRPPTREAITRIETGLLPREVRRCGYGQAMTVSSFVPLLAAAHVLGHSRIFRGVPAAGSTS